MTSPHSSKTEGNARPGDRVIDAEFLAGAKSQDQFPPPVLSEIAFAGRSNVGKSSLLNTLLQRRGIVRTSSTPGCTRQISWFRAKSDDQALLDLVDLPGYGYARRSKSERITWGGLIDGYLLGRATLRGVILLVDARRGIEEDDLALLELVESNSLVSRPPLEVVVVATKLDKLNLAARKPLIAQLSKDLGRPVLGFSSETAEGRLPLWRKLRRIAGVGSTSE